MDLEERAADRKEYVMRIRSGFQNQEMERKTGSEKMENHVDGNGNLFGIRTLIAVMIFAAYLISAVSGMNIYTFTSEKLETEIRREVGAEKIIGELQESIKSVILYN